MKFKLKRQEIDQKLVDFGVKKIKQNRVHVPRATSKTLKGLAESLEEIQKNGLPKHLVLKKLKKKLGHGIFLHPNAKPILKGEVIAPYSGEVALFPQNGEDNSDYVFSLVSDLLLTKQEQLSWDPGRRYHPRRLYSIDLDAHKKGNFTRFINHSAKPNVEAHFLRIPANSLGLSPSPFELLYIAKKTIRPGEQLLLCYEGEDKSYWGVLNIKPFPMTPKTFRLISPRGQSSFRSTSTMETI
ncbi:MAG: SET domain-containing protein [Verrucomicrobiota bacterium]|nr:SET domain-containing protein [Verrucomicrobiota bacterium]